MLLVMVYVDHMHRRKVATRVLVCSRVRDEGGVHAHSDHMVDILEPVDVSEA